MSYLHILHSHTNKIQMTRFSICTKFAMFADRFFLQFSSNVTANIEYNIALNMIGLYVYEKAVY